MKRRLPIGTRVKLNQVALDDHLKPSWPDGVMGTVVGYSRNPEVVRVHWDHHSNSTVEAYGLGWLDVVEVKEVA